MSKAPPRIFLDWQRPLLEQAAELLLAEAAAKDETLLDLSDTLAIVPTRNAARRLREMLANLAGERGQAVIPPLCGPPTLLVRPEDGAARIGRPLAGAAEVLAAWIGVLREIDAADFVQLFPVAPQRRDFAWAQGMARDLIAVRSILGEAGLLMGDLARRLPADHEEKLRWQDLARLEADYLTLLRQLDRCDPVAARRAAAERAELPVGISKIVLLGTPDPFPLAVSALERMVGRHEVTVMIYAPESLADTFDAWGQPLAEHWGDASRAPIEIAAFESAVRLFANPDHQDQAIVEMVESYAAPEEVLGIGVLDSSAAALTERALRDRGFPGFAPEGRPLRSEGIVHFLETLRDFTSSPLPALAAELVRTPEVDAWAEKRIEDWHQASALKAIDQGIGDHLLEDCQPLARLLRSDAEAAERRDSPREVEVRRLRMAAQVLEELLAIRKRLTTGELAEALPEVLREILVCRSTAAHTETPSAAQLWPERVLEAAGPTLLEHLGDLSRAVGAGAGIDLSRTQQMALAISLLAQGRLGGDRPAAALELQGWLELLWEDAPHLVVAGLNDGVVPETVVGHPFLPESLRSLEMLELKNNAQRFARDAYLLTALLRSRDHGGRVDLFLLRRSREGDPVRPSRLLLQCADEHLPARVRHVFREVETDGTASSWDPGFQLLPDAPRPADPGGNEEFIATAAAMFRRPDLRSMSVTSFRAYLDSPFHYYLQRLCRLKTVDPALGELDALEFGNFCHHVLEAFGSDETARDLEDEAAIARFLMAEAERRSRERYGISPALAVRIQLRAARRRLEAAARVQALRRQDGWRIVRTEFKLGGEGDEVFEIGGVALSGRVDRLDDRDGERLVLDYKTSDSADDPARAHFSVLASGVDYSHLRDYVRFQHEGREKRWTDLQLALYCLALESEYGAGLQAGYFSLPKALADTTVATLELDDELRAAALRCAEGIVADIQAGRFWPLREGGAWDDLAGMHLGVPDKVIDARYVGGCLEGGPK